MRCLEERTFGVLKILSDFWLAWEQSVREQAHEADATPKIESSALPWICCSSKDSGRRDCTTGPRPQKDQRGKRLWPMKPPFPKAEESESVLNGAHRKPSPALEPLKAKHQRPAPR